MTHWADEIDWPPLVRKLKLFAHGRLSRARWRRGTSGGPPGGKEADDLVHDAIRKTLDGQRTWDPDARTLFIHLAGVIRSDISHLSASRDNTTTLLVDVSGQPSSGNVVSFTSAAKDVDKVLHEERETARVLAYLKTLDSELYALAELIFVKEIRDSIELSTLMRLDIRSLNNLKKRLRRALSVFLEAVDDNHGDLR